MIRRVAIWLEGEQEVEELAFMLFMLAANTVQGSIHFFFPDPPAALDYVTAVGRLERNEEIYPGDYDVHVFLTRDPIEGNLFFMEYGPLVQVTSAGWQRDFAPPSLFEYLMHSILSGVTFALADIESHDDFTMGCQFEYTRIKSHDRIDIALGFICPEHRTQIAEQIGKPYLNDILSLVSFQWIGDVEVPGTIASRLRAYFGQDLGRDSGFKKSFLQRIRPNLDTLWFDIFKEVFKGAVLIFITYLLFRFGLKKT